MLQKIKDNAKKVIAAIKPRINSDRLATGIMRWPRPVAFFLLVVMFVIGWFNPAILMSYASALAVFPDQFWQVIFILMGSISASKLLKDLGK